MIYRDTTEVYSSIDSLVRGINTFSCFITEKTTDAEGIFFQTTKELDEQLRDIKENEENWQFIYKHVLTPFLNKTSKINELDEKKNVVETGIICYGDYYCDDAKSFARFIKNKRYKRTGEGFIALLDDLMENTDSNMTGNIKLSSTTISDKEDVE